MWVEPIIKGLESSETLNTVGRALAKPFSNVVRPGRLKDLLSGTWTGHPLHPALTDVPVGMWASAQVLDLIGGEGSEHAADALVLTGILAAAPTAATGWSEFADIETRDERSVGTAHALGNISALVLYGLSYVARKRGNRTRGKAMSAMGLVALTASAFLGGHLSFRRGVGVNQTAFSTQPEDWTAVLEDESLEEGKARRAQVQGTDIMLYRLKGTVYAIGNRCSHRGGPLHKGRIEDDRVTCPWHLSTFSIENGAVLRGPATAPQPSYDVRVNEGKIEVRARR